MAIGMVQTPAHADVVDTAITGLQSQKCIDVPHSTFSHVQLDIYNCLPNMSDDYPNLIWTFHDAGWGGGFYQIKSSSSDQCITVLNASMSIGAQVIQYPCIGVEGNNEWRPISKRHELVDGRAFDSYRLQNYKSGLCLTVLNASTANGAKLIQHNCDSTQNNDRWTWW